jgi:hypothetical protein
MSFLRDGFEDLLIGLKPINLHDDYKPAAAGRHDGFLALL